MKIASAGAIAVCTLIAGASHQAAAASNDVIALVDAQMDRVTAGVEVVTTASGSGSIGALAATQAATTSHTFGGNTVQAGAGGAVAAGAGPGAVGNVTLSPAGRITGSPSARFGTTFAP